MKRRIVSIFALATLLTACSESENTIKSIEGEVTSTVTADATTEAALNKELSTFEKEELQREKEKAGNVTSLKFDKVFHDFGDVESACVI